MQFFDNHPFLYASSYDHHPGHPTRAVQLWLAGSCCHSAALHVSPPIRRPLLPARPPPPATVTPSAGRRTMPKKATSKVPRGRRRTGPRVERTGGFGPKISPSPPSRAPVGCVLRELHGFAGQQRWAYRVAKMCMLRGRGAQKRFSSGVSKMPFWLFC